MKKQINQLQNKVNALSRKQRPRPKRRARNRKTNYVHSDKSSIKLFTLDSAAGVNSIVVPINPGAAALNRWDHSVAHYSYVEIFPRLKQMSRIYEYWRVKKLSFRYKSRIGSTQAGSVSWCFDYDPADNDTLLTDQEISAHEHSDSFAVYNNSILRVDPRKCHMQFPWLFCRDSVVDTPRLYDAGQLVIRASTTNLAIGDIYMDYEFEFACPSIDDSSLVAGSKTPVTPTTGTRHYATPFNTGAWFPFCHTRSDDYVEFEPGNYYVNLFFELTATAISTVFAIIERSTDGGLTWETMATDKKTSTDDDASIAAIINASLGDLFRFGYESTFSGLSQAAIRLGIFTLAKYNTPKTV